MEQAQAEQLGAKMREAYTHVAEEPAEPAPKHVSRRLRKSGFAGKGRRASSGSMSLVQQHPIAALLTAAGIGYVLSRL